MKTMKSPLLKVSLSVLIYLQSFNSSASDYFLTYIGSDEKIEKPQQPIQAENDSNDVLKELKSVDLVSTSVIQENEQVKISWETGMEMNNGLFTVERSTDIQNWEKINELNGAGTSSQIQTYTSIDKTPYEGISYYRIKYTDFNGNFGYSRVEAIDVVINSIKVQIFPQPAEDFITLHLSGFNDDPIELTILSSDGLTVKERINGFSGNQLNVSDLNSGIYFLHIRTEKQSIVYRMIKK